MNRKATVLFLLLLTFVLSQVSRVKAQFIDFDSVLTNYSQAISGKIPINNFDIGIQSLINDRIQWYNEYFEKGLNSELILINSEFVQDEILKQDSNTIIVQETVTLTGKPLIQVAEDHPSIKSLRFALRKNQDEHLVPIIEEELRSFLLSVQSSIDAEIFSISWVNQHKITFQPLTGKIIGVEYSSYARGDDGNDVIIWDERGFRREKIDLTQMPDYILNHTTIELMAEEWLKYFEAQERNNITYTYSRTLAASYINRWVTNTTSRCQTAPVIVTQNVADYNPAYGYWTCADCANYVSQALYAGGLPQDSIWRPGYGAWIRVGELDSYLIQYGRGTVVSSYTTLSPGDLGLIPNSHVAMVAQVNPILYSAHTSDKLKAGWPIYTFTRLIKIN